MDHSNSTPPGLLGSPFSIFEEAMVIKHFLFIDHSEEEMF
jgi:hypothetical protein